MTFHQYGSRAFPGLPGLAAELHHAQSAAGQGLPQRFTDRIARTAREFDRPAQPVSGDPARFELMTRRLPALRRRERLIQAA